MPTPTALPIGVADLTGAAVEESLAHRAPIAVLIDDNRVARPQSGFNAAAVVYQAPADGGETRYMLIFQEEDTDEIGPVRSGRIYFIHWASELRAGIAHYGGDNYTRWYMGKYDHQRFTNIDALGSGAKAFHRIKSRAKPHNGYTSTAALRKMAGRLGGPELLSADLFRRPFVEGALAARRGAKQTIKLRYNTGSVEYQYDRESNSYTRYLDGRRQVDPADGQPVRPTNVVVLFQKFSIDTKIEPGHARPVIECIGEGRAIVIHDGHATEATWSKASETSPTHLVDSVGDEIPLVRGQTFIQIVPLKAKVSISG